MASWAEFAQQAPELAAFGQARFQQGVAYLGTVRADGGPRVHPVTPIIGQQLFLFIERPRPRGRTCGATAATPCTAPSKIRAAASSTREDGGHGRTTQGCANRRYGPRPTSHRSGTFCLC
jgi:hypothetical protein